MKRYHTQSPVLVMLTIALGASLGAVRGQEQKADEKAGYLSPTAPVPTGKAPGIKVRLLSETGAGLRRYIIVLAKGDEVMSGLTDFARQNKVRSATFTAIGAFSHATVAWFDDIKKQFKLIPINEQVELVSMIGNITLVNDKPVVHTHVSVASSDGIVHGGHVINAFVFPTLELFMTVYPTPLHKELDQATGLNLIDPSVN